jgi:hypothetical protein
VRYEPSSPPPRCIPHHNSFHFISSSDFSSNIFHLLYFYPPSSRWLIFLPWRWWQQVFLKLFICLLNYMALHSRRQQSSHHLHQSHRSLSTPRWRPWILSNKEEEKKDHLPFIVLENSHTENDNSVHYTCFYVILISERVCILSRDSDVGPTQTILPCTSNQLAMYVQSAFQRYF